jgi:hypothetical protein
MCLDDQKVRASTLDTDLDAIADCAGADATRVEAGCDFVEGI